MKRVVSNTEVPGQLSIEAASPRSAYEQALVSLVTSAGFLTLDGELEKESPGLITVASTTGSPPRLRVVNGLLVGPVDYADVCDSADAVFSRVKRHYEKILLASGALDRVHEYIGGNLFSKKAVIDCWTPHVYESPCLMYLWFRPEPDDRLACHAHFRGNDVYRKLFMNLEILEAIHEHVATRLGLGRGTYVHYSDSLHIYRRDWRLATSVAARIRRHQPDMAVQTVTLR